jgi:hypothetical protein
MYVCIINLFSVQVPNLNLKINLQGNFFQQEGSSTSVIACWKAGDSDGGTVLKSLAGHLFVLDRHLCIAHFKDDKLILVGTRSYFSRSLPAFHRPVDIPAAFSKGINIFDMGYIGDFVNENNKCQDLLKIKSHERPSILQSIADPSQRQLVPYCSSDINKKVPINNVQLQALKSMKYDVEGIQGPPGTGKSTMIYHVVNSFLGPQAISLATCVQNKAVDAIAEKLASANNIGFFVFGNEERLGLLAQRWTLAAQTGRDGRVVRAARSFSTLLAEAEKLREAVMKQLRQAPAESLDELVGMCESDASVAALRCRVEIARKQLKDTGDLVRAEILGRARVMLCTVATAAGRLQGEEELEDFMERITAVILDEAGTSSESKLPSEECGSHHSRGRPQAAGAVHANQAAQKESSVLRVPETAKVLQRPLLQVPALLWCRGGCVEDADRILPEIEAGPAEQRYLHTRASVPHAP